MNVTPYRVRDRLSEGNSKTDPFPDWRVICVNWTEVVEREADDSVMSGCDVVVKFEMVILFKDSDPEEEKLMNELSVCEQLDDKGVIEIDDRVRFPLSTEKRMFCESVLLI